MGASWMPLPGLGAAAQRPWAVWSALALLAAALILGPALYYSASPGDPPLAPPGLVKAPDLPPQPVPAVPAISAAAVAPAARALPAVSAARAAAAVPAAAVKRRGKGVRRSRRQQPVPLSRSLDRLARACPALASSWVPQTSGVHMVNPVRRDGTQEPKFGRAQTQGGALARGTAGTRTCFELQALDQSGNAFDQGPLQRAYFQVLLTKGGGEGDGDGVPVVRLAACVQYVPASSTHRVCFTPLLGGVYDLAVFLVFDNAWRVAAYLATANGAGYKRHRVVARTQVTVESAAAAEHGGSTQTQVTVGSAAAAGDGGSADAVGSVEEAARGVRPPVPGCSFDLLRESGNEGSWIGQHWRPNACDSTLLETEGILKSLNGKRVAFVGDSEMRYTFNILRRWLRFHSTEAFVKAAEPLPMFRNGITLPPSQQRNRLPFDLRTCQAAAWHTKLENGKCTYYGTFWTGFAHYVVSRPSHVKKNVTYRFNITYIVHVSASDPLGQGWMANKSFTNGATVPDEQGPYDLAFVSIGLHDVTRFDNATGFAAAFRERYLPALRTLVKSPDSVVFFGIWAANELQKSSKYVYRSNNMRGAKFENEELKALQDAGFSNFISTRLMTMSRPDLCIDSTHYSWPVTLAMLNLAFASLNAKVRHGL